MSQEKKVEDKKVNRRNFIKVAGGAVAIAAAGGAYYLYQSSLPVSPVTTTIASLTSATSVTQPPMTEEQLIQYGFSAFEPAQKPLAQPQDWISPPSEYKDKKEIVIGASMPMTGIFSWAAAWQKLKDQMASWGGATGRGRTCSGIGLPA